MKAGWRTQRLGELCEIVKGRKPHLKAQASEGDLPYLVAKVIRGSQEPEFAALSDRNSIPVSEDETIIICDGSNSGEVFTGYHGILSSTMGKLVIKGEIDDCYLRAFLKSTFEVFNGAKTGAAIPHLDKEALYALTFSYPSLSEQRRIVALLDEAFADIATAKANAEKNLQNARELFESNLQATFTFQEGWTLKSFGELAEFRNGINFTKSSRGEAIKIVGVRDFQTNFWAPLDDLETIIPEGEMPASDLIQSGDILFVRSNGNPELIGRSLLVGDLQEPITHSGFTIKARLRVTQLSSIYLCHYLKSGLLRREMIEGGNGANIKSLNQGTLSRLKIAFPDKCKQLMLVEQLEKVQAEIAELESIYRQKLTALDDLKKSLLNQAFSGQL